MVEALYKSHTFQVIPFKYGVLGDRSTIRLIRVSIGVKQDCVLSLLFVIVVQFVVEQCHIGNVDIIESRILRREITSLSPL